MRKRHIFKAELNHVFDLVEARLRVVPIALLSLIVAYGFLAFNQTFAGDDWVAITDDGVLIGYALENGRWIHAASMAALDHSRLAPTFTMGVLLASMLVSYLLCGAALGLGSGFALGTFIVLAGAFPFWAELASFRILHLSAAFALLASVLYGHLLWRAYEAWEEAGRLAPVPVFSNLTLAAGAFSLSAAAYQGFLPVGAMLVAGAVLGRTLRGSPLPCNMQGIGRLLAATLMVLTSGVLLYAAQVEVSRLLTGTGPSPDPAYQISSSLVTRWSEFVASLARLGDYLLAFFGRENHLFPLWPKLVFGAFVVVFGAELARALARRRSSLVLSIALMAIVVLVLAPWLLGVVRVPNPYRYSAIVSSGLLYAVLISLAVDSTKGRRFGPAVKLAALAVCLCFLFQQNAASLLTYSNNLRDRAVLQRLLDRIEEHSAYPRLATGAPVTVVLAGEFAHRRERPFKTAPTEGPLNSSIVQCDILDCQPARLQWAAELIKADHLEYQFRRLDSLTLESQQSLSSVAERLAPWPQAGSIAVVDDVTVVVRLGGDSAGIASEATPIVGALSVSESRDGAVEISESGGVFSVAAVNTGARGIVTVSATAEPEKLPMVMSLCRTDPATSRCISSIVPAAEGLTLDMHENAEYSFGVFVACECPLDYDPLANRIVVRFRDSLGVVRGATSVAIRRR